MKRSPATKVLVFLAWFVSGCASTVSETKPAPAPLNDLTDAVIERYIRTHPEVIVQSLQAMEAKREAEQRERQKVALAAKQSELLHDTTSPVSGNPKGEITLIEFYDYRCGYCKKAASAVTELQKVDPRVRVVYKDFPILGEPSVLASKTALASQAQGKQRVFHEALLASPGDMSKDTILKIAIGVGLDAKRLEADMANPQWQAVIDKNRALAQELGISGTRGIATGIISSLITDGRQKMKPVHLQVLKVNPARKLYKRLEFSVIEETPTHYIMQTSISK